GLLGSTHPQAATPTFSPVAGTYTASQSVTLSDATPGALIYYTTNGTTPTTASTLYSGPIAVSTTTTIKAVAVVSGFLNSVVATASYTINPPAPTPRIATTSLPNGTRNAAYSATLTATGGTTPYTWSILSGSLPAGLTLASNTGVISGTPTGTGTSTFTVQVTDANSQKATKALSLTITGSIQLVNTATGSDSSGNAVPTISTNSFTANAGNFIAVVVRYGTSNNARVTLSDTAGNGYTLARHQVEGGSSTSTAIDIYYAKNIAGATSNVITASFAPAQRLVTLISFQYSGVDPSSPLDVTAGAGAAGTASTMATSNPFTTTSPAEVIVVGGTFYNLNTLSAGAGYTMRVSNPRTAGEDRIVSSLQNGATATMLSNSSNRWIIVVAAFKAAGTH
ncbi:MAG TPA: chitobiase/beta-hexosaminidase C-terminal domain-containing protein, partial [Candidatus Acidoferrales bacterium]|nr:chitobiase/beta-hexosaminidase C-terminal domain-containing protein [Candidatus Acidoferrales bacterium]